MLKQSLKAGMLLLSVTAAICVAGMVRAYASDSSSALQAEQSRVCTGTVVDGAGVPVIGASVLIKGTLKGTSTDIDGHFSIPQANPGDILQVTSIGYLPVEVTWDGSPLTIALDEDPLSLEESVVVGYGVQKKVNVTGSVSTIGSEALSSRPVQKLSQALQGQVPGLNFSVTTGGGELNQGMSVNVRGIGTIGAGSSGSPLVLIDGIEGNMNTINYNDVESISVLKDAASSSIYGARGAFGVILITTKSGKAGNTHVSYNGSMDFSSAVHLPRMMRSDRFVRYFNRARALAGQEPMFDAATVQRVDDFINGVSDIQTIPNDLENRWGTYETGSANTDWFRVFYGDNAPSYNHNVSISGGTERLNYRVSGTFQSTEGLLKFGQDKMNRYNLDAKIGARLTDWARLNFSTKWIREDYTRPTYLTYSSHLFMHNIARRWPNVPVYDPNGHLIGNMETEALQDGGEQLTQKNYYTNQIALIFEPIKDWRINIEGNMRTYTNRDHQVILPVISYDCDNQPYFDTWDSAAFSPGQSRVYESRYTEDYFTTNIYSDYSFSFADSHNFHVLAGFNAELTKYDTASASGDYLVDINFPWLDQTTTNPQVGGGREHHAVAGFFGRINYNYKERYLLELNGRYDGSSRFIGDKRWAFFPSISAGWNIAKEPFFEQLSEEISTLKLRASWGSLGNTNTNNWYPFYETMPVSSAAGDWIIDGKRPNVASIPGLISPYMTWETIQTLDFGLDITAARGRLNFTFDWFRRVTKDMIGPAPELPAVLGADVPRVNNSDMLSRGWEIELGWRDQIGHDFSYGARLVLSDSRQFVTRYPNETMSLSNYYNGREIGEIWGYQAIGLARTQAQMNEWLNNNLPSWGSGWGAGDLMYVDVNGDGKVNSGNNTLDDHGDLEIIGNSSPRYNFGIMLDAAWKGIDIKAYFQGVGKRDYWLSGPYFTGAGASNMWQCAAFDSHWDFWRDENDEFGANLDAYFPKPQFDQGAKNFEVSSHYLQNAAYIRLKNIQIGYSLPHKWIERAGLSSVRLYVSGENLLTFTKMFKEFDPETIGGDRGDGKVYPILKTYSFGVNINF